jgi:uncharacterized repeat protein (TIGR01451 family)
MKAFKLKTRISIAIFGLALLVNAGAGAAISYDNDAVTWKATPGGTTWTSPSFTMAAGSNQILVLWIDYEATFTATVTFGGHTFSLIRSDNFNGNNYSAIYYFVPPPTTANTFTVTFGAGIFNPVNFTAFSYSGVNQATPGVTNNSAVTGGPAGPPYALSDAINPSVSNSTIVELSNMNSGGCAPNAVAWTFGNARYSDYDNLNKATSLAFADYAPGSTAPFSFNPSFSGGCGTTPSMIVESFELLPAVVTTPTPTPSMPLVKTINVPTANLGDTVTYCVNWTNNSSAAQSFNVWDTVPASITYLGCISGCAQSGGVVSWSLVGAAAATSGTFCFWGRVSGYPLLPGAQLQVAALPARDEIQALFFPLKP